MSKKQATTLKSCIAMIQGQVKTQRVKSGKYRVISMGNKPMGFVRRTGNVWNLNIKGV